MPNAKGGKGYKKGKHSGGAEEAKMIEWDEKEGQMLGRILKSLGNRRFRVYGNDNKERIAKLPGSMRKSEWVDEGAIVLLGIRELSNATAKAGKEVADILTLVSPSLYGKLKKQPGVNPLLFNQVEKQDAEEKKKRIKAQEEGKPVEDDDIFDRGAEDDEDADDEGASESEDGLTGEEKQKQKQLKREERDKKRDQKLADERKKKEGRGGGESDIDIDNI